MTKKNMAELNDANFKLINAINKVSALIMKSFETENIDDIMQEVLKILGLFNRADRCFIWKNYHKQNSHLVFMKQIYEWVDEKEKIEAVQDSEVIDFITYEPELYELLSTGSSLNALVKDMDEYNKIILEAQDIKAVLIIPIFIEEYFWGFIGFDNCHSEELWTASEEKTLVLVSSMLAVVANNLKPDINIDNDL